MTLNRLESIEKIIKAVAELPHRVRTSEWPEEMFVTASELGEILLEHSVIFVNPPIEDLSTWIDAKNPPPPPKDNHDLWMVTDGKDIYFDFYWLMEYSLPNGEHYPTGWYSAQTEDPEPTTLNITHYKAMPRLPKE